MRWTFTKPSQRIRIQLQFTQHFPQFCLCHLSHVCRKLQMLVSGGTLPLKGARRQSASPSQMLGDGTGAHQSNVCALCQGRSWLLIPQPLLSLSAATEVFCVICSLPAVRLVKATVSILTAISFLWRALGCFPFTFGKSLQSSQLSFLIVQGSFDSLKSSGIPLRKFSQFLHIFTTTG